MRKVDRDELVFVIYHELRNWGVGYRRAIFKASHDPTACPEHIPAMKVAEVLRRVEIIDPAEPRRALSLDELVAIFVPAIRAFPGAIGKLWLSRISQHETDARQAAAILLAKTLDPYFVLSAGKEMVLPSYPRFEIKPYALQPSWP